MWKMRSETSLRNNIQYDGQIIPIIVFHISYLTVTKTEKIASFFNLYIVIRNGLESRKLLEPSPRKPA